MSKKQKQNIATFDLHGLAHDTAEIKLEDFFMATIPPFKVITGASLTMQRMTSNLVSTYGYEALHMNPNNLGETLVIEK